MGLGFCVRDIGIRVIGLGWGGVQISWMGFSVCR